MTSGDLHSGAATDDSDVSPSRPWLSGSAAVAMVLALVALGVAVIAAGIGSLVLYERSGAFWPEAIPPYVQYLGDSYHCMDLGAPDMRGLTVQGRTFGGGLIHAHPPDHGKASYGFVVVTDGTRHETCVLGG